VSSNSIRTGLNRIFSHTALFDQKYLLRNRNRVVLIAMKTRCDVCGDKAIGMQMLGCCGYAVCEKHADMLLKALSPGEKKEWGACFYWRYD